MSKQINETEFNALAASNRVVKADSERGALVERIIDERGCTLAVAVYTSTTSPAYTLYSSASDCDEWIVSEGVACTADQYDGDPDQINGSDAVRIYAVDEESALILAEAYTDGEINVDNTTLGNPGVVQSLA